VALEPLVSAVIPTHDNAEMAAEAVESVLAQTYTAREIIVVDDGSSDDTVDRLSRFEGRICLIRQEHMGPAVARNAGIKAAKGELVAFLDSDDLWLPEKLARCIDGLQRHPEAGVVYTAVRIHEMDANRKYVLPQYTMSGKLARALFVECKGVNTSTLVVRRSCLDRINMFDEELFRAQDWDLMIRLAEEFEYLHVPEVLTERRLHARSLSVTHADLYAEYNLRVIRKALARRPDLYRDLAKDALARAHFRFGMAHYRDFRMREARGEFRQSLSEQWNGKAFNYLLRSVLPAPLIRLLRRIRLTLQSGTDG